MGAEEFFARPAAQAEEASDSKETTDANENCMIINLKTIYNRSKAIEPGKIISQQEGMVYDLIC